MFEQPISNVLGYWTSVVYDYWGNTNILLQHRYHDEHERCGCFPWNPSVGAHVRHEACRPAAILLEIIRMTCYMIKSLILIWRSSTCTRLYPQVSNLSYNDLTWRYGMMLSAIWIISRVVCDISWLISMVNDILINQGRITRIYRNYHDLTLIPAWISNHMPSKLCD